MKKWIYWAWMVISTRDGWIHSSHPLRERTVSFMFHMQGLQVGFVPFSWSQLLKCYFKRQTWPYKGATKWLPIHRYQTEILNFSLFFPPPLVLCPSATSRMRNKLIRSTSQRHQSNLPDITNLPVRPHTARGSLRSMSGTSGLKLDYLFPTSQ